MKTVLDVAKYAGMIYSGIPNASLTLTGKLYADSTVSLILDPTDKTAIVVCCGTKDLHDALKDLESAIPKNSDIGVVATGFYDGIPELAATLLPHIPKDYLIIGTGHSLGGSQLDDLFDLFERQLRKTHARILIEPAGTKICTPAAKERCFAFRNGLDIVPLLPTWANVAYPLLKIDYIPTPVDPFTFILDYHHIANCLTAIAASPYASIVLVP